MKHTTLEKKQIAEINRLLPAWYDNGHRPSSDAPMMTAMLHVINQRIDAVRAELMGIILDLRDTK